MKRGPDTHHPAAPTLAPITQLGAARAPPKPAALTRQIGGFARVAC